MPTLRSKVMVKAMLKKAPALALTKVQTRETRGKRKLLQQSKGRRLRAQKTATNQRKVSNKSLSEEDLEELCGMLEEKREELDRTIKEKIESSANLGFYP